MLRSLTLLAALSMFPARGEVTCAMRKLVPAVLTPPDSAIPIEGGVVVGAVHVSGERHAVGDVAVQAGWRFVIEGATLAPKIESLAPGLAVYRLPATATRVQLRDGDAVLVKIAFGEDKPLALAAPKIKTIAHTAGRGTSSFEEIEVSLGEAVPPGAVALVLADAKGQPRSWGRVDAGGTSAKVYYRSRCQPLRKGSVESVPGDQVTVYWIDRAGRRSPAASATVIAGA
jgi:hypothetical protein